MAFKVYGFLEGKIPAKGPVKTMKYAFSTLGCPDWTFTEIVTTAMDLGYSGVEIRGIEKEVFAPFAKPFLGAAIDKTIQSLKQKSMEISMLTSGVVLSGNKTAAISEGCAYIDLADKLGVKFVRVMVTPNPFPEECSLETAKQTYRELCAYASYNGKGVTPLVETNGVLADSNIMKEFMSGAPKNSGVLWDVHHPYRFYGETPEQTCANIGKLVKYVHVKDSVMDGEKVKYKIMGQGDVPVLSALSELSKIGYNGYVSLEWVKRWCPELEEAGIVFSRFSNFFKTQCKDL